VTACFAVLLFLSLSLGDRPNVWKGIAIGVVVALGWWFKSTVLLSVPLVFVTLIVYWKTWWRQWKRVVLGLASGASVGFAMVVPVLFNPNIDYAKTQVIARTLTIPQILAFPWGRWTGNWIAAGSWFVGYGGPVLVAVWLVSLLRFREKRMTLILAAWALIPIVIEVTLLTSLSGRLLAISVVPLIILIAAWLSYQHNMLTWCTIGSVALCGALLSISPLTFYQTLKPIPAVQGDFGQYVTSWPSGYGVKEAVDRLIAESRKKPIVVFVRIDSGNPEDAVISYLQRARVPVFYLPQINDIAKIKELALLPWYFVSRGPQYGGIEKHLTEVVKFKKPLDDEFIGVYKINP
jgi:hypothetical protein